MSWSSRVLFLSLVLSGCAVRSAMDGGAFPERCERYGVSPPDGRISETVQTIDPTDAERTDWRLSTLHDAIMRFQRERGILPDSLPALLQLGPPPEVPTAEVLRPQAWWLLDSWGEQVLFNREGKDYRLTSAGPDRRAGTTDDINTRGPCTGSGNTIRLRR